MVHLFGLPRVLQRKFQEVGTKFTLERLLNDFFFFFATAQTTLAPNEKGIKHLGLEGH